MIVINSSDLYQKLQHILIIQQILLFVEDAKNISQKVWLFLMLCMKN